MNMKLVCFIILFSFFSCSDVDKEEEQVPELLLPGKSGSSWQYKISTFYDSGSKIRFENRTMRFTDNIDYNGHVGYKVENILPYGFEFAISGSISTYYIQLNDGLYLGRKDEDEVSIPPRIQEPHFEKYFKYPTFIGDTLLVGGAIMKTEALGEQVTVPFGSFKCIKYSYVLENDTLGCIWFKPKVGIIRIEELWRGDKILSELVGLNLVL